MTLNLTLSTHTQGVAFRKFAKSWPGYPKVDVPTDKDKNLAVLVGRYCASPCTLLVACAQMLVILGSQCQWLGENGAVLRRSEDGAVLISGEAGAVLRRSEAGAVLIRGAAGSCDNKAVISFDARRSDAVERCAHTRCGTSIARPER